MSNPSASRLPSLSGSLEGMRVLVLRPEAQADDLARELSARGAEPVVVPAIRVLPPSNPASLNRFLDDPQRFDWLVFTSVNGVESFFEQAAARGIHPDNLPASIAVVGPVTGKALEDRRLKVTWVPSRFTTEALAAEFPSSASPVCVVRAENAGTDLEESLRARGFEVERVDSYRSEPINSEAIAAAVLKSVDAIAFTSASIVESFVRAVGAKTGNALVCSIGPATSATCHRVGLAVDVEADDHTAVGLVRAIGDYMDRDKARTKRRIEDER